MSYIVTAKDTQGAECEPIQVATHTEAWNYLERLPDDIQAATVEEVGLAWAYRAERQVRGTRLVWAVTGYSFA